MATQITGVESSHATIPSVIYLNSCCNGNRRFMNITTKSTLQSCSEPFSSVKFHFLAMPRAEDRRTAPSTICLGGREGRKVRRGWTVLRNERRDDRVLQPFVLHEILWPNGAHALTWSCLGCSLSLHPVEFSDSEVAFYANLKECDVHKYE